MFKSNRSLKKKFNSSASNLTIGTIDYKSISRNKKESKTPYEIDQDNRNMLNQIKEKHIQRKRRNHSKDILSRREQEAKELASMLDDTL